MIRRDDGEGHILLSSKEANDILAWDKFKKYMEEGTNLTVKVGGIVKSGVVAYLDGIRGFIPASRLSLNYVEEDALNDWLGKSVSSMLMLKTNVSSFPQERSCVRKQMKNAKQKFPTFRSDSLPKEP